MSLRQEIVTDLKEVETDLGSPTFLWKSNSYVFIPSISEFKRELDTGGFQIMKLLTATVRKFNIDTSNNFQPIFPNNTLPTGQDIITYSLDGTRYRIESIKNDPTNSYFRLTAVSTSKGV